MSGKRKEFLVLAIGDREAEGYDELALPRLLQMIDSSAPDAKVFTPLGVLGFYLRSPRAASVVERVISQAESLRDSDKTFATLGIGLAHGPLIADFHADGSVNPTFAPLGEVANRASRAVQGAQNYREVLSDLYDTRTA